MAALTDISISFPEVWKFIDENATKSADHLIENIGMIQSGYNEAVISLRSFAVEMTGGSGEAYRKEIESLRELSDWHDKMDKQREKEREGFSLLRQANEQAEARSNARAESERINSIKTVQGVDDEIMKLKEKAGAMATVGKMTEDAAKAYSANLIALENRRAAVEKQNSAARSEFHKKAREEYTDEAKAIDDLIARHREVYDLEQKRIKAKAQQSTQLTNAAHKEDFNTAVDAVKDTHEAEKDIVTARLKQQGATELQIKQQVTEMDKKFSQDMHNVRMQNIVDESKSRRVELQNERDELERSGIDGTEREKRLSKIKAEENKLIFDLRKRGIEEVGRFDREQNKLTHNLKLAAINAQLKAEEDKIAKTKAMNEMALNKTFDAKKFGEQQDPQKVFKQFQQDRMKKAQMEQAERDRDLAQRGVNGDDKAMDKFYTNQKRAMQQAKNQALQDAQNGNVGSDELQKAQAKVGQETVANFQKQGKLSSDVAKAMQDSLTSLANNADAIDNLQATVDQLVAFAKGQKQVAKRQSENARNQQNSLE